MAEINADGPAMRSKDAPAPDTGNTHIDAYLKKRRELLDQFPKGYQVAGFDGGAFQLLRHVDGHEHVLFACSDPKPIVPFELNDQGTALA